MQLEQITDVSKHSWEGQGSENPKIQAIINKGFWVDKITGNLIHCSLYGSSEIDYLQELPPIAMIRHENDETYVVFNIGGKQDLLETY